MANHKSTTSRRSPAKKTPRASRGAAEKARPKRAASGADKPRQRRRGFRRIAVWAAIALVWLTVGLVGLIGWYAYDLPDPDALRTPPRAPSVQVVSVAGDTLATYGQLFDGPVVFSDLPPELVQAIIATEDRRFFDHRGFDPIGIARAAWANLRAGAIRQGGSTITQQLAKNLFLTPARSFKRKIQETVLALWLESRFSKEQLLAIYANRVYFGAGAYGVAAAARKYFARPLGNLNLHEYAVLAGLLKAPSRYAPSHNLAAAKTRAGVVLANMVAAGYLAAPDAAAAARMKIRLARPAAGGGARYFTDWALSRAAGYAEKGAGDLVIVTTLDPKLQRLAERVLGAALARGGASQGALVALAPNGAVRAMVGGADYAKSPFNRATQALRQPGSAFKLFVYLAALEAGIAPDDTVRDAPLNIRGWRPRNFDGRYRGDVSVADALANSFNTPAVRISERVGRDKVTAVARRLGITTPLSPHPALALGVSEARLIELTAAYGALANGGQAAWPYGIVEIKTVSGETLYRRQGGGAGQVLAPAHVAAMHQMLGQVVETGTGKAAKLARPAAGKSGTSQSSRDGWFIGYTADMVAGVWMGHDDSSPVKGLTGGGAPARLWRDFMRAAHAGLPPTPLPTPRSGWNWRSLFSGGRDSGARFEPVPGSEVQE